MNFGNCPKLKAIIGNIVTDIPEIDLGRLPSLEYIRLKKLKGNVNLKESSLISYESIKYMIDNAANTSPITITVHPDVYAKLIDETNTEWHNIITDATAKNVSFATV